MFNLFFFRFKIYLVFGVDEFGFFLFSRHSITRLGNRINALDGNVVIADKMW